MHHFHLYFQELLPLILCVVNLHGSAKSRDSMLHTLFNLIKKPDGLQRQMILAGCVMFASHNGPEQVENELLPQCWEQVRPSVFPSSTSLNFSQATRLLA